MLTLPSPHIDRHNWGLGDGTVYYRLDAPLGAPVPNAQYDWYADSQYPNEFSKQETYIRAKLHHHDRQGLSSYISALKSFVGAFGGAGLRPLDKHRVRALNDPAEMHGHSVKGEKQQDGYMTYGTGGGDGEAWMADAPKELFFKQVHP